MSGLQDVRQLACHASIVVDWTQDESRNAYVMQLEADASGSRVAAVLSSRRVKVYSVGATGGVQLTGDLVGHEGRVYDVQWSTASPTSCVTASDDGTVRVWDTRTRQAVSCVSMRDNFTPHGGEVWSVAVSQDDRVLVAPCNIEAGANSESMIKWYDARQLGAGPQRVYGEAHQESISLTRFHPSTQHLITAGMDGLVCAFDPAIEDEDEAVVAILNVEESVSALEPFGPGLMYLCVSTSSERAQLWSLDSQDRLAVLSRPSETACLLRAFSEPQSESLYFACWESEPEPRIVINSVSVDGMASVSVLPGTHTALARTLCRLPDGTLISGGEDSRIAVWRQGTPPATPPATKHQQQPHAASGSNAATAAGVPRMFRVLDASSSDESRGSRYSPF